MNLFSTGLQNDQACPPYCTQTPSVFNWRGVAALQAQRRDSSCCHWEYNSISIAADVPVHNDNLKLCLLGTTPLCTQTHTPKHNCPSVLAPFGPVHPNTPSREQASAVWPQLWTAQRSEEREAEKSAAAIHLKSECNELEFHWFGRKAQNQRLSVPEGLLYCCTVAPHKSFRGLSPSRTTLPE